MRPHAIAVDPGVDFAVAWSVEGEVHARNSARWDLRKHTDPGTRYLALWEHLKRLFPHGASRVLIEFGGVSPARQAALWFAGYLATVQTWAAVLGTTVEPVAPNTVRKWATGRGVASKPERAANKTCEKDRMRAAALARWPGQIEQLSVIDHNRIDALWVLAWGLRDTPEAKIASAGCGGACGCPSRSCPQPITRGFQISLCDCKCHPVPV